MGFVGIPHRFPLPWEHQPGLSSPHVAIMTCLPCPRRRGGRVLLGTDPPGQPEGSPRLGAPQRVSLSTRLGHRGLSAWPEGAIIALHGPVSTSLLPEQLQLKPREIWRDGAHEGNHTLSSLPVQCLDGTTLGSLCSGWGWLCPFLREGSPSCSSSTVCVPACWLLSSWKS